ncbi:Eco57I restriction-modification methylase domain-containing protein [Thermodesulfovibrionales bacterium]|nr:Eco57I restriction-modification methylase domain-containing protein [Thermodesulfovibrionales bacterium]
MSREILADIINDFETTKFIRFFREKSRSFAPLRENLLQYEDDNFKNGWKLGEIKFAGGEEMSICTFRVNQPISERSGKKSQYEKAKRILRETQSDAGIFIFYDEKNHFRFSLIYANYRGTRRDWSSFRRFTYFVSPELTNKTFLQRIGAGDFSSLKEIKDAFSVEKVTRAFYADIANWYFWAVQESKFPKDAEKEASGRNIAVIRLITRLIFIWFMKEKGLIQKALFNYNDISGFLKDTSPENTTYYKAVLQNLFFATLNTKIEKRDFRSEIRGHKGYNPDFGKHYVFRYHQLFKNPQDIESYFNKIPFLNGGLFECLDDKDNRIYIDGFTATKKHQPEVPNFLFFSDETEVDLNEVYDTKNKKHKVMGLLNILSSYNFTIDENVPDDQEVALDPELLGKVFENLLASFNPETASTARKATGSYYTPREIVDYMVTQSLKAYFKANLNNIDTLDNKLEQLFSNDNNENPFSESDTLKMVKLTDNLRIVDPAVGSGAFPMGILNKLVFILSKLDPENKLWKEAQIEIVKAIPDPNIKNKMIKEIEDYFQTKKPDYWRKLYLIQKCIYGVDIQQIAVEIAKLRFFISLLVDEEIDKEKENWGIEPLPNLDFKLMQGNSLISEFMGINFDRDETNDLFRTEEDDLIDEFQQKKNEFQNEPDKVKKDRLKQEIEDLMIQIFETKLKRQRGDYFSKLKAIEDKYSVVPYEKQRNEVIGKKKQALCKKTDFDLESAEKQLRDFSSGQKTKPFFLWNLYFAEVFRGENQGFDIVIANPPYVSFGLRDAGKAKDEWANYMRANYPNSAEYKLSIYAIFMDKGIQLLRNRGVLSYITPDSFLLGRYFSKLRRFILRTCKIKEIVMFEKDFWESGVIGRPVVTVLKKELDTDLRESNMPFYKLYHSLNDFNTEIFRAFSYSQNYFNNTSYSRFTLFFEKSEKSLVDKLQVGSKSLSVFVTFASGLIGKKGKNEMISREKRGQDWHPGLLSGSEIKKYIVNYEGNFIHFDTKVLKSGFKDAHYFEPKILLRQTGDSLVAAYDDNNLLCLNNIHVGNLKDKKYSLKYILALLNSTLLSYYYRLISLETGRTMAQTDIETLELLPIKIPSADIQNKIVYLVDKILAITSRKDYDPKATCLRATHRQDSEPNKKVHEYEKQIDEMVYKLYGLTDEEIRIVEDSVNR